MFCLSVSLSLSLRSTFIHLPFALNLSTSSLVPSLFFFVSLQHSASAGCTLPFHSFCPQTLPLSFPLSLSAYSSCALPSLCNLAFLCPLLAPISNIYFSWTLSTSSCSFHPQISAPYINTLSTMLSNIIILLLKSPPHFLSPIPHTHPTTLFTFLRALTFNPWYVLKASHLGVFHHPETVRLVLKLN
jgi:hypothetical protein